MTTVRRLQAAAALTAGIMAVTCWHVGSKASARRLNGLTGTNNSTATTAVESNGMFAERPVITYRSGQADAYFALQLKPDLGAASSKPRDFVAVIDISASQAGAPLRNARLLLEEMVKQAGTNDRFAVWVVNTPEETRDLTRGLRNRDDAQLKDCFTELEKTIYAAGATDLKVGLKKVLAGLSLQSDRRTAVVYLGDGDSVLDPLNDADRMRISTELVEHKVPFISVPLGIKLNAKNLHGLAHATGGCVVRVTGGDKPKEAAAHVLSAVSAPIYYPNKVEYSAEVVEALPNRLPPLRSDTPVLVAGSMKAAKTLECRVEGDVDGRSQSLTIKEKVPEAAASNFFLSNLVKQWRGADRSAPAIMRADRGLALAFEQTRLARDEFINQAVWAVGLNKLDAAQNLYEAAKSIDPTDSESAAGLTVVRRLKAGEINKDQLFKEAKALGSDADDVKKTSLMQPAQEMPALPPADAPAAGNLLDLERRRRAVQEQQITAVVDDAIRQARQLVNTDPDAANDLLKRQLASIRDNGDLSESIRAGLAGRLEGALRTIEAEGARVKQRQESDLRIRIEAERRRGLQATAASEEERIRERVRVFGTLMDRARYDEARKESLELAAELVAKGHTPPPAVQASSTVNHYATNLQTYQEIRKLKDDRVVLQMLLVEKSHLPFEDEPPVAFPPASVWKQVSDMRRDRYASESLGGFSRRTVELRDKLAKPVNEEFAFDGIPLRDVLKTLSENYGITFIVNLPAFKEAALERVEEQPIRLQKMPGVSLSTILNFMLSQVQGTYVIKRDYVEITTRKAAAFDKIVKAYPVADLVIPIPSAVDPLSLQQNLQVLGSSLSANGQAIFGSAGGGLNLGNFGGALGVGALGVGGVGGFGALGVGGGAGGAAGAQFLGGAQGFQGGALGFAGGTNSVNLGFGGGVTGFGGGQQGQFGNLGGQFGIQGGDTSQLLIDLIQNVIAPKEWNTRASILQQQASLINEGDEAPPLDISLLNALQYYQPSRALVVRGSSKVHTRTGEFVASTGAAAGAKAPNERGDMLVFAPKDKDNAPAVAAAPKKPNPAPVKPAEPVVAKAPHNPKELWQDNMAQGKFKPRNVIAMADVLSICNKFEDASELLKANIRQGLLTHPAVFDALAVALEGAKASVEEVERARLSKIDLDSENPKSFVDLAQSMIDLGRHERALEFCKRAAELDAASPDAYRKVLTIKGSIDNARYVETVKWAATNLLDREWEIDGNLNQQQAKSAIENLANQMQAQGRRDDAAQLRQVATRHHQRDLVIELAWSDPSDLDLIVTEPVGTTCSVKQPRTPAGGSWIGDKLGVRQESYSAAQGFTGSYDVTVRRIWGEPMGNKATLKVTYHQGTPEESTELHTLVLDSHGQAKVKLDLHGGRRVQSEAVPVSATVKRLPVARESTDDIYATLRAMADPNLVVARPTTRIGSSAGATLTEQARTATSYQPGVELSHQTKVSPALSSGVDLLTQTTISSDRSSMRVSLTPAFDTVMQAPHVPLASVPGGQ